MDAKLIHDACMNYLPTNLPAQFYGLPDGKVYVVFARFYTNKFKRSDIEYVFATHEEFLYDYENEKLTFIDCNNIEIPVYNESVDKDYPKINIFKELRTIQSFGEAALLLDKKAKGILAKQYSNMQNKIQLIPVVENEKRTATA